MSIPRTLEERLRGGRIIPFVGAGVSMAVLDRKSGTPLFPSWGQLLKRAADRLDAEQNPLYAKLVRSLLEIDRPDYLEAARRAREGLKSIWFDFLKEQIDHTRGLADENSLSLAQAIWSLGSKFLITTNYDKVLRWACPQESDLDILDIVSPVEHVKALRGELTKPTLWHLHGRIENAIDLVLAPESYNRLYGETDRVKPQDHYREALHTLRSLLISHTFIFIGFSLNDAHFGLQLLDIHEIFAGASGPHYALIRESEAERVKALNPHVIVIPFANVAEPLLNLVKVMGEIAHDVESPNTEEIKLSPTPYDPRNSVFFVPYPQKGNQVIGREEALQAVHEQLTKGRRTAIGQTAAFQGLGGLGKTQLAVEYAYRYKNEYPNGVIWLNADQNIDAQLTEIAVAAKWIAPESEHNYKLDIARQRLRAYSDCLIVFDNLEEQTAIKDYLPESQANPHILVTSRTEQPGFTPVPLELLNKELSLKLLLQEAGREPKTKDEIDAAREIAETLDGLPLALELAGAYLRLRHTVNLQQYRDLLKKNLKDALLGKLLVSFTKHETDLYSTLKINEEIFADEPRLRDILDLLTWSGPAPMGISLLCALLEIKDSIELTNALSLGTTLRLLQKSADTESYAVHRLVREVRREDIHLNERKEWINSICQRLGVWFQARKENFTDLPQFEAEIDHLRSWQEHALTFVPEHASRLTWLQGYPPYHRGRYSEAKEWVNKAFGLFKQRQENDLELQANLLLDLGATYSMHGDFKNALDNNERSLIIRQEIFGQRHPDTASSFNSVGAAYGNSGDYKRNLEYAEKALTIRQELFGEHHPYTASSFDSVGTAYSNLGDYKRHLEYAEKALAIRQKLFGERHPDIASSFYSVGGAYGNLGDYKHCLEYAQKALEIRKELFGESHPRTASSFDIVGRAYINAGDHKPGLEYVEKALRIRQELFGEYHPDIATSFDSIGVTYEKMSNNKQAKEFLEKAFKLRQQLFGDQHPGTVFSAHQLAVTLYKMGRGIQAFQLLDKFLSLLPKDHIHYAKLKSTRKQFKVPGFR